MAETTGIQAVPFTTFNFKIEFTLEGEEEPLCYAAFSECDGLEVTMEPKTYQEGGNNVSHIHLVGRVTYSQLTLKRGMTTSFDLWDWFDRVVQPGEYALRATGVVTMLDAQRAQDGEGTGGKENASFLLTRCIPIKIKAPALNATDGGVAIEELQVAYERLKIQRPQ